MVALRVYFWLEKVNWIASQIHILHGESFIREPWSELQKVENFLGLEPVIGEQHFFFNGTKVGSLVRASVRPNLSDHNVTDGTIPSWWSSIKKT